jgi:hypothetical protein
MLLCGDGRLGGPIVASTVFKSSKLAQFSGDSCVNLLIVVAIVLIGFPPCHSIWVRCPVVVAITVPSIVAIVSSFSGWTIGSHNATVAAHDVSCRCLVFVVGRFVGASGTGVL